MILDRRPNRYSDQNLLLQAVLGMLSGTERLHRWLGELAPPSTGDIPDGEPSSVTLAVLGLIALAESLERVAPPRTQEPIEQAHGHFLNDLLR